MNSRRLFSKFESVPIPHPFRQRFDEMDESETEESEEYTEEEESSEEDGDDMSISE
jgi:hypothetical protein